ncbi:glycoprotein 3-alpha-L-fucosyltransferase A-like [Ostrea edulis]|uniref:glycoprotein 3-alpha-L-fucosyltransferase A-like n=1 Tax=Ostrea edulis TaxID=37623 RepID=UPI002094BDD9|nr:glycoprotein 3-alpha-L-fucosyltransferase A-like [Ostrea edulis]
MKAKQHGIVISVLVVCALVHYVIYNLLHDPNQYTTNNQPDIDRASRIVSSVGEGQETISNINSYTIMYYDMPSWMSFNIKVLNSSTCPQVKGQCLVYTDNKYLDSANAVIFYGESLGKVPEKKEGQIWTFFSIESPFLYSVGEEWNDKFSWTLTYREDSDFKCFYGKVYKRETPLVRNYSEIFRKKTKNVAWAVSNCNTPSKREWYVKKLQQYIDIDIYGRCGKLKCGTRSAAITECHKKFAEEYKFFLAVENSVCKDYTTEKLFNFFFHDLAMIPIVNGPQNVHEYIPKGTYINIMDYSSPSELAQDLQRIGSDEDLYSSYLRGKDKYGARQFSWYNVLCPMCARLHEEKQTSSIPDINSWIWKDTCIKPSLMLYL